MEDELTEWKAEHQHEWAPFFPPLTEQELEEFETKAGYSLPAQYRTFLRVVGNRSIDFDQNAGDDSSGIRRLCPLKFSSDPADTASRQPFVWVRGFWAPRPPRIPSAIERARRALDPDLHIDVKAANFYQGYVHLSTTHTTDWVLVTAGKMRGTVWRQDNEVFCFAPVAGSFLEYLGIPDPDAVDVSGLEEEQISDEQSALECKL